MRQVVGSGSKNTAADYKAALNCVRLVTRLLPFVMEDQSDDFLEAVFWRSELPVIAAPAPTATPAPENGVSDTAEGDAHQNGATPAESADTQPHASEPAVADSTTYESAAGVLEDALLFKGEDPTDPLAIRLLNAIVNLLFYPNFTVSPLSRMPAESETFPLEHVWERGVGVQEVRACHRFDSVDLPANSPITCIFVIRHSLQRHTCTRTVRRCCAVSWSSFPRRFTGALT
jgi:hypothetical protein